MENVPNEKKVKNTQKQNNRSLLAVKKETRRKVIQELAKINKKSFGRKVHADALISLALSLIKPEHIQALQEESLSNSDRLEQQFQNYREKHNDITKDEYLGKLMRGEITLNPTQEVSEKAIG